METEIVNDQGPNNTDFEWVFDAHNFSNPSDDVSSVYQHHRAHETLRKVSNLAMVYFAPLVVALGLACNLFSFVMMVATNLRRLSRTVYLIAICVTDQSFLILLVLATHSLGAVDLYNSNDGLCKLLIYVVHVIEVGKLFVVLLVADMYVTIRHPRLAGRLCRPRRAAIIVICVAVAVSVYSLHALTQIGTSPTRHGHATFCRYHDYSQTLRLHIVDITLLSFLPMTLLVSLGIATLVQKQRPRSRSGRVVAGTQPSLDEVEQPTSHSATDAAEVPSTPSAVATAAAEEDALKQRIGSSSLALPVTVAILYALTLVPATVIQCVAIYDYVNPGSLYHLYDYYYYVQQLIHTFSYLYFSSKPVMCAICWQPYRRTLVDCAKNAWHLRLRLFGRVPYRFYREDLGMTTVN